MTLRYHPKTKPYKHQARAALAAVRSGNHLFYFDPGLGKTKAALDASYMQHMRGKVHRVVVITTLMGIDVWKDELALHLTKEQRREIRWIIINHEKISYRSRPGKRYVYPYVQAIERFNPDLIVLDESHKYKRASSNRATAMWRLVQRLRKRRGDGQPFVYELTGTPNPKGWIDLFAQIRIADPEIFGTSKADFEEEYCTYGFGKRRFTIIRYRNVARLKEKIKPISTTVHEEEAVDLPPKIWQTVKIRLPADARAAYDELAEEMIAEIENEEVVAKNSGVLRMRLLQITGGFTPNGRQLHDSKLAYLRDEAESLQLSGQGLVVYCRFLNEVSAVEKVLSEVGYITTAITGKTSESVRTSARREFQRQVPDRPVALVFQADTGSLAITLTAGREAIFYSLPDAWDTYWQCTKRLHRIGQTRSVRYRHLVCPGTVDMSVLRALRKKADMHRELMGNPRGFVFGGERT